MGSRGQSAGPQALSQWRDDEDDGFGDFDVAPKSQKPEPDRIAKYREAEDNDAFMDDLIFGGDEQIIHEVTGSSGVDLRQLVADSSPQQQGGPKLFKLDDLSKLGYSLDDLHPNMAYNPDEGVWEGPDADELDLDLSGFDPDEVQVTSRRPFHGSGDDEDDWENAFAVDDLQLPDVLPQPGRAQSASSQGFIPLGGSSFAPLTLPKPAAEQSSTGSQMVFNPDTLCWEGGDVDLAAFETDSDGYTGHEDNWDNDFDEDDVALRDRLQTRAGGITDFLSKVFRREQPLTTENINRHKAKHPQRPILITPEDVNMNLFRANSRLSAFSDEVSGMDESDNTSHNNDEEDWNEGLEGDLDLQRISRLTNDERMIVVPLGGPASENTLTRRPSGSRTTNASPNRGRTSPVPRPRPVLSRGKPQIRDSQRTLIKPGEHNAIPVTDMVLDETAMVWREKGRAPIDLDDEKRNSHKRNATSTFDRASMPQEFALTEAFCGAVMTSEKEHNACIRAFLGEQDYQKMLATGARRLAEKSPIKYSRETLNRIRRSMDAADDVNIAEEISKHKVAALKASARERPTSATSEHSRTGGPVRSPRPPHNKAGISPGPAARKAAAQPAYSAQPAHSAHPAPPARPSKSQSTQSVKMSDIRLRVYREVWNFVVGNETDATETADAAPARRRSAVKAV